MTDQRNTDQARFELHARIRSEEELSASLDAMRPLFGSRSHESLAKMAAHVLSHAGDEKVGNGVMNIVESSLSILARETPFSEQELRVLIPSLAFSLVDNTEVAAEGARILLEDITAIIPSGAIEPQNYAY